MARRKKVAKKKPVPVSFRKLAEIQATPEPPRKDAYWKVVA